MEIDWLRRDRLNRFSKDAADPNKWTQSADRLVYAMQQLAPSIDSYFAILRSDDWSELPEHDCHFTLMMLGGYAIENLCKGCLVRQLSLKEAERLRIKGTLPKRLTHHSLQSHLEAVGFPLTEVETNLVGRVERAILWQGRYPLPKAYTKTGPTVQIGSDVRRLFDLIGRLRRHVAGKKNLPGK